MPSSPVYLSREEQYALAALSGLLAQARWWGRSDRVAELVYPQIAHMAFDMAQAMLTERQVRKSA